MIEKVEYLRKFYPKGTRIECDCMNDPYPVPKGTKGTVVYVDDAGQIHADWDNGSTLALTDIDNFHKIKEDGSL